MDREELKAALREVLSEETGLSDVELGGKWERGEMVIRSTHGSPREKVIPLEGFFRKIVMVRDRLRIIEQKINGHPGLSSEEKVGLQQYITKAYGTLTTFNFLFRERKEIFVGEQATTAEPLAASHASLPSPETRATPSAEPLLG